MMRVWSRATLGLIAGITLLLGVGACGDAQGDAVVVRVGGHVITQAALDHWIPIEAVTATEANPTHPPPQGIVPVPPDYVGCIGYLSRQSGAQAKRSKAELKRECAHKYKLLQNQILELLITYYWVSGEAAAKGVVVTNAEVAQLRRMEFPSEAAYRQFLRFTGETVANERLLAERLLLSKKLQALAAQGAQTSAEKLQAVAKFATHLLAKWTPRTSCRPRYVVAGCRQYHAPGPAS